MRPLDWMVFVGVLASFAGVCALWHLLDTLERWTGSELRPQNDRED